MLVAYEYELNYMIVDPDSADYSDITRLLAQAKLTYSDLQTVNWQFLMGNRNADNLVAVAGLEHCDGAYLLRSVVVAPAQRGQGIATQLIASLQQRAKAAGIQQIHLLTMDTADWFSQQHGYRVIPRESAPESIRKTTQFSTLCPADAVLMCNVLS